ncbi:hypothetical protein HD806DRAFT_532608 [Xylariaceae sp. AK1471]|nr:hypothetical protein HD806DRAFT_532608 [Xylariaceae sp. AK1471]
MCVTVVLRRVRYEENPVTTDAYNTNTSLCLFGGFCCMIGHSHVLYQDDGFEVCSECDRKTLQIARWSLTACTATFEEPPICPERLPPPYLISTYNDTVQSELLGVLSRRIKFSKCKVLLHYILGLPRFIDKIPLIEIFGESVSRWCGYKRAEQLKDIATEHKLGREMGFALQFAFKRQVEKKKARQRRKSDFDSGAVNKVVYNAY